MKNLPRVLQVIWLLIAAVSVFEAYLILNSGDPDKTSGYLFCGVAVFSLVRYVMLRRKQFNEDKKVGKYK